MTRRLCLAAVTLALPALLPATPPPENAELAVLAPKSLLLDVTASGDQLVAVGERGHLLVSTDKGVSWAQRIVPTRAMLTGVTFPDPQHGWAVGHDGVILASTDGGATWTRQDNGRDLDTVYLDVLFLDARHGFAVGAYGKCMETRDAGATWTAVRPIEDEVHFNRIAQGPDGTLFLAGEGGLFLSSHDQGATWSRIAVPYDGSLFGIVPLDARTIAVCGLRGHILVSSDAGANWAPQNSDVKVLIMAGTRLRNGIVVLAGQGGNFFISRDSGHTFNHWKPADFGTSVADLVPAEDGWVATVGEAGAVRIKLP